MFFEDALGLFLLDSLGDFLVDELLGFLELDALVVVGVLGPLLEVGVVSEVGLGALDRLVEGLLLEPEFFEFFFLLPPELLDVLVPGPGDTLGEVGGFGWVEGGGKGLGLGLVVGGVVILVLVEVI